MTSPSFITPSSWLHIPPPPEIVPLVSRPCFFCGEMMEIRASCRQLICRPCDVTEACDAVICTVIPGTALTGTWKGVAYLDHSSEHAPNP